MVIQSADEVVHNDEKKSKNYTFDLSGFKMVGKSVQVWQTRDDKAGQAYKCRLLPARPINNRKFTDVIPTRSVTTYLFQDVGAP